MINRLIDVIILKSNSIIYDTRVGKIFNSLNKRYSVRIFGWNREGLSKNITAKTATNQILFNFKAPIGKATIIGYYPFFWMWIFYQLIRQMPNVVHACDLDTAPPAYLYKLFFRKKLVFDVFDRYAMVYINPKNKIMYKIVNSLEEYYAQRSDVLITVGNKLLNSFKKKPKICSIIMNCPEDKYRENKPVSEILKLVYTGNIVRNRGLEVIAKAIRDLDGTEFDFAGRPIDKILLKDLLRTNNVHYIGLLSLDKALELEGQADVIISLYDPKIPNYQFAVPNKFLLAMMFGVPTITSIGKELIEENNCGIFVDYDNIEQVKNAIIKLRDNKEYRNNLGKNGRFAFTQKYNWNLMERELFKIYKNLDHA